MPRTPTLGPVEQKEHLDRIALGLLRILPPGRQELVVRFDRIGRAAGHATRLTKSDGTHELWELPRKTLRAFDDLRTGMRVDGLGTWFVCRFRMVPSGQWDVQYSRSRQPKTNKPPTPEDFALEQQRFPRSENEMPDWYRAGLAGTPR